MPSNRNYSGSVPAFFAFADGTDAQGKARYDIRIPPLDGSYWDQQAFDAIHGISRGIPAIVPVTDPAQQAVFLDAVMYAIANPGQCGEGSPAKAASHIFRLLRNTPEGNIYHQASIACADALAEAINTGNEPWMAEARNRIAHERAHPQKTDHTLLGAIKSDLRRLFRIR